MEREELYQGSDEGSLIYQFDVIAVLNAAFEMDGRSGASIAIEYDGAQFDHGPFSPDPRSFEGARFTTYRERMDDEGLARFRERMEEIRARRAVVRRIWCEPLTA